MQAHLAWDWEAEGKPRHGLLNDTRLHMKAQYKLAIRNAACLFENDAEDELSNVYLRKDFNKFWKKWQNRFSKRSINPLHINDERTTSNC